MIHLKRFKELFESIDSEKSIEERLEDVEDMLIEITDQWPLLSQDNSDDLPLGFCRKNPEVKNIFNQTLYYFRLKSKWVGSRMDDPRSPRFNKELWPRTRGTWGTGISKDYYNAAGLDEEIKTITQMISHTRLNKSGHMIKSLEWKSMKEKPGMVVFMMVDQRRYPI
jgi:hypothetical protein